MVVLDLQVAVGQETLRNDEVVRFIAGRQLREDPRRRKQVRACGEDGRDQRCTPPVAEELRPGDPSPCWSGKRVRQCAPDPPFKRARPYQSGRRNWNWHPRQKRDGRYPQEDPTAVTHRETDESGDDERAHEPPGRG